MLKWDITWLHHLVTVILHSQLLLLPRSVQVIKWEEEWVPGKQVSGCCRGMMQTDLLEDVLQRAGECCRQALKSMDRWKDSRTGSDFQLLSTFPLILLGNIGNFHHITPDCNDIIIVTQALNTWIEIIQYGYGITEISTTSWSHHKFSLFNAVITFNRCWMRGHILRSICTNRSKGFPCIAPSINILKFGRLYSLQRGTLVCESNSDILINYHILIKSKTVKLSNIIKYRSCHISIQYPYIYIYWWWGMIFQICKFLYCTVQNKQRRVRWSHK